MALPDLLLTEPGPLDQHPALVYLKSLSEGSRDSMRASLDMIAQLLTKGKGTALTLNWPALRYQHTSAARTKLVDRYEPATVNKMLSALRGVLKASWRLNQIGSDDYFRAIDIKSVSGSSVATGRALSAREVSRLLEICANDPTPIGARDGALIALLYSTGLRRAEACALNIDDLDLDENILLVRGKRRKQREMPLNDNAVAILEDWLKVRGRASGPLFCRIRKTDNKPGCSIPLAGHLSSQAIYKILLNRAKQANLKSLSPHDLRRSYISDLLKGGADLSIAQKLAGHSNPQTTVRYDKRGHEAKQKAVDALKVPRFERAQPPKAEEQ